MSSEEEKRITDLVSFIEAKIKNNNQPRVIKTSETLLSAKTQLFFSKPLTESLSHVASQAIGRDWCFTDTIQPLTASDIHFLKSVTVDDLLGIPQPDNSLKGFIMQVLIGTISGLATAMIVEGLTYVADQSVAKLQELREAMAASSDKVESSDVIHHDSHEAQAVKQDHAVNPQHEPKHIPSSSSQNHHHGSSSANHANHTKGDDQLVNQPSHKGGVDPSWKTMQRIGLKELKGFAGKLTAREVKAKLDDIKHEIGQQSYSNAIRDGLSSQEAHALSLLAKTETDNFISGLKKGIGTGLATVNFLNSVSEKGFFAAVADVTKDSVIKQVSSMSAKQITYVVGASNPVTTAYVISTVIKETFTTTETAPAWHDRPPLSMQQQQMIDSIPKGSSIPLFNNGPTLKPDTSSQLVPQTTNHTCHVM